MAFRSKFQREGAVMKKALSPQVLCLVRMGGQEVSISRVEGVGGSEQKGGVISWSYSSEETDCHALEASTLTLFLSVDSN